MKGQGKLTVIIAGAAVFAVGVIFAAIGEASGGNFFRAMEHAGNSFYIKTEQPRKQEQKELSPYDYGYGYDDGYYNDIEDFFREFGFSDDEIEQFIYPSLGGGSGRVYY